MYIVLQVRDEKKGTVWYRYTVIPESDASDTYPAGWSYERLLKHDRVRLSRSLLDLLQAKLRTDGYNPKL
jgi:hypothetical protein